MLKSTSLADACAKEFVIVDVRGTILTAPGLQETLRLDIILMLRGYVTLLGLGDR